MILPNEQENTRVETVRDKQKRRSPGEQSMKREERPRKDITYDALGRPAAPEHTGGSS